MLSEEMHDLLGEGDDIGVVENRHDGDSSDEPRPEIEALTPGDRVRIRGVECKLQSTGKRVNYGQRGLYSLGIPPEAFGTVATLYVNRDPDRLDICNGEVYDIDPSEVDVLD